MTEKNKEMAVEMFKMRLDGATYQEIADKYGISKQRVHSLIGNPAKTRLKTFDYIVYKGLKTWMEENKISIAGLTRIITKTATSSGRTKSKLEGKAQFKLDEIILIIKESGLSFEQLFIQE